MMTYFFYCLDEFSYRDQTHCISIYRKSICLNLKVICFNLGSIESRGGRSGTHSGSVQVYSGFGFKDFSSIRVFLNVSSDSVRIFAGSDMYIYIYIYI